MIIQTKTLELIARHMGNISSGSELLRLLEECNVPKNLIIYPNTKWRMLYNAMFALSKSSDNNAHKTLFKIITAFLHPLSFGGDEKATKTTMSQFNQWLKYDNLEIDFYVNELQIRPRKGYQQIKEDQELYESQAGDDIGEAIRLIKSKHLDNLILLKKSYQLLMNIVNTFIDQECNPTHKLNEAYLQVHAIVERAKDKILSDPEVKELNSLGIMDQIDKSYHPFANLFGAEEQYQGLYVDQRLSIKRKMNQYYGEIVSLCFACEAGDILAESEIQKLLNKITLYLTEIKEKEQDTNRKSDIVQNQWQDDFRWEGDKFVFGEYGDIYFDSEDRKVIFQKLADSKGKWVSIIKLRGNKDDDYVRSTISQIEARFDKNLKKYMSIPSTKDDDLQGKPDRQGAYRIKFTPIKTLTVAPKDKARF